MAKLIVLAVLLASVVAFSDGVDGIAARVGSDAILRSEVVRELQRAGMSADRFDEMRDDLIDRLLILKAASDAKMTLQEWVVDNRVQDIVNRSFGGDRNRLMALLQAQKVAYPEWRKRIREDMIVGAMRWQIVDRNTTASPSAMRAEYETHPERYVKSRRVTIEVILLKPEDRARREEVSEQLKKRSFGDVAREYSADSRAAEGGLWKDVDPRATFKPEVCDEIDRMAVGETSKWIEIAGWSFLVHKVDVSAEGRQTFEEAYDEIEAAVKEAAAKELYLAWLARLRAKAFIRKY